ncbi:MAG: NHLP bacteriocin system secretion protein [Gemmataceae bacterium]
MSAHLFRETPLNRLSSPEQLDQLLRVTSPKGWLTLLAVGVSLVALVVWSIVGTIDTNVEGRGLLTLRGDLMEVVADNTGPLERILVKIGDEVHPGQVVAHILQSDIVDEIQKTENQLTELRAQQKVLSELGQLSLDLELKSIGVQRATQKVDLENAQARRYELDTLVRKQRQLLAQAIITEQSLLTTQQQLDAIIKEIGQSKSSLEDLTAKEEKSKQSFKAEVLARQLKIDDTDRQLVALREKLDRAGKVVAQVSGHVVAIRAARNSVVNPGTPILALSPEGDPTRNLEVALYVDAENAKRIKEGMAAQVSPATVRREKFGYLQGSVTYISELPVSAETMEARLENKDLVQEIQKELGGGAAFEVRVRLVPDPETPSGYAWSSPLGPPQTISEGTLCTARITVLQERPIGLVIPLLKKETGLD